MPDPDADIPDHLRAFFGLGPDPLTVDERAIKVAEEIRALTRDGYEATDSFPPSSPMGTLLSLSVGATLGTPRFAAEVTHVAPVLREFVNAYAAGTTKGSASDAFRALTRLVWLRQPEDVVLIGALAHQPFEPENAEWSGVAASVDSQHSLMVPLIEAVANPFPPAPIAARFLATVNDAMTRRMISRHPFDCAEGVACLKALLSDFSEQNLPLAWEAAKALHWISGSERGTLVSLARAHPSEDVQVELAGALAGIGEESGFHELVRFCKNPVFSELAQNLLERLNATHLIPEECSAEDFRAMVEMVNWLSSPMEYGKLPASISVLAKRTMLWPPAGDVRDMWILEFTYPDFKPAKCRGCVGSTTFSLGGNVHDLNVEAEAFRRRNPKPGVPAGPDAYLAPAEFEVRCHSSGGLIEGHV